MATAVFPEFARAEDLRRDHPAPPMGPGRHDVGGPYGYGIARSYGYGYGIGYGDR